MVHRGEEKTRETAPPTTKTKKGANLACDLKVTFLGRSPRALGQTKVKTPRAFYGDDNTPLKQPSVNAVVSGQLDQGPMVHACSITAEATKLLQRHDDGATAAIESSSSDDEPPATLGEYANQVGENTTSNAIKTQATGPKNETTAQPRMQ